MENITGRRTQWIGYAVQGGRFHLATGSSEKPVCNEQFRGMLTRTERGVDAKEITCKKCRSLFEDSDDDWDWHGQPWTM